MFATAGIIFSHLISVYRIYKTIQARYKEFRLIFKDDIKNSKTKFDDKALSVFDKIFLVKK